MKWNRDFPYNNLPPLPSKWALNTEKIQEKLISARVALARLDEAMKRTPNQAMVSYIFPILEAKSSSEIENIITTTDELFQFLGTPEKANPAVKEALRYRSALFAGLNLLRQTPLSQRIAIEVCSKLRDTDIDIRSLPGTCIANSITRQKIYTPPTGKEVILTLLRNWERFLHQETPKDPLLRMSIAHYQFEAIHPFSDGNGRTGRILNLLYLVEQGLLHSPVLYLSRYIIQHKNEYYEKLLGVTKNKDWESWNEFMLNAIEETANWTKNKIDGICRLEQRFKVKMQEIPSLKPIYSHELIELLFTQPYIRIKDIVNAGIAKRQTASKYLQALHQENLLSMKSSEKEKLFINYQLLDLLNRED